VTRPGLNISNFDDVWQGKLRPIKGCLWEALPYMTRTSTQCLGALGAFTRIILM